MKIAMLGSGFIARFYADSLIGHRRTDVLHAVYSRDINKAKTFATDYKLPIYSDDMHQVVNHPEVDVVVISLPNDLHLAAVEACAKAGSMCCAPSRWAVPLPRLNKCWIWWSRRA